MFIISHTKRDHCGFKTSGNERFSTGFTDETIFLIARFLFWVNFSYP
jgi:hypothetical protein